MHNRGLSLVEIVVSTILIALVLAGLANLFVAGRKYVTLNTSRTLGIELGKAFLDPLQMDVRQDLWGNNCLSSNPTSGCPTVWIISNIPFTPSYNIGTVNGINTLRRVQLTISWPKD